MAKLHVHREPETDREFTQVYNAIEALRSGSTGGTLPSGGTPLASVSSLHDLDDVDDSARQDGYGLEFSSAASGWIAAPLQALVTVTDITPTATGLVYSKVYEAGTSPASKVLQSCEADTDSVRVHVEVDGPTTAWQPVVTVTPKAGTGLAVVVTNLTRMGTDTRRFSGYADITMDATGDIDVSTPGGFVATISHVRAAAPPAIQSASWDLNNYPGSQTAVKSGDVMTLTGTVDTTATTIKVKDAGASSTLQAFPGDYSSGTFSIVVTIGSRTSPGTATLFAENTNGSPGADFTTSNAVSLDQTYPNINAPQLTYPAGQQGLKGTETVQVMSVISQAGAAPVYLYESPNADLSVPNPTTYAQSKNWQRLATANGYLDSGTNARITATRTENDATTVVNFLITMADTAAVVSVDENGVARLRANEYHTIRIVCNQNMNSAIGSIFLSSPRGAWQGAWAGGPTIFTRQLFIGDSDIVTGGQAGNTWSWYGLSIKNKAGVVTTTIDVSGGNDDSFLTGGFTSRTLTIPAWTNREAALGVYVVDTGKVTCFNSSKNKSFTFAPNTTNAVDTFTITDGAENYTADGDYFYNNDEANASSNTSGTAEVIMEETV